MKPLMHCPGKAVNVLFIAFLLLSLLFSGKIIAQQQQSTFSIAGWVPGSTPVFSGAGSNVAEVVYGDSLNTILNFAGVPGDGMETDHDNAAFVSFTYSYTVYLTPAGTAFSNTSSIPVATHTVSASQSCGSSTVPPWTIGYDAAPTASSNYLNMNIADAITDCIPAGNYQVDIVFNNYSQNSVGPNPAPIQLAWAAYTSGGPLSLTPPSSDNTAQVALSPAADYILTQVAFVHISAPVSCPKLTLTLPQSIHTFTPLSAATVVTSYLGQCSQNPCTYLWSNGETTATATGLRKGNYTVTVTSPCGNTATASVTISNTTAPNTAAIEVSKQVVRPAIAVETTPAGSRTYKHEEKNAAKQNNIEAQLIVYPNPARQFITFDLSSPADISTVKIFDLLGNEVMIPMSSSNDSSQKLQLNIEDLPAGAYVYELLADKNYRGKFIKQ